MKNKKIIKVNFKLSFSDLMEEELKSAREKHGKMMSLHEAASVIYEEYEEFWDQIKKKTKDRDVENMKEELIQIAAMCCKTYEDLIIPLLNKE